MLIIQIIQKFKPCTHTKTTYYKLCGPLAGIIVLAGIALLNKYSLVEKDLQALRQ
jgi:hypothetical protein